MIWREKRGWLIAISALLVVNLFVFFTYRVRQRERIEDLRQKHASLQQKLQTARAERSAKERQLNGYRDVVKNIRHIYDDVWSTSDERLTPLITEMYRLAKKSGLQPQSYNYRFGSEDEKARTTSMEIGFNVKGTYSQVRQLINLLELSDQFVFIDQITLSGDPASAGGIQLNLRLKTLFGEPNPQEGAKKS